MSSTPVPRPTGTPVPSPRRVAPAVLPDDARLRRVAPAAGGERAVSVVLDVPEGAGYPQDHELVELGEVLREMAQELAPWVRGARVSLTRRAS
ncbi:hypothetical protein [Cellulomonas marina]|uniref:Uncharacterized protein n=1 Tax=Cellulomonas marina TaxID=988821 RepID=A0A1I1A8F9_9CELL|nr:hypothetical protein [Cellulomonas marina]GIG29604.1 hypothetical protein Cma02nite_22040 [Cellulomonas marina]SFB33706.1 hypothetical protein SAMN05421867_11574 [Cellulomonas marina]